MEQDLTPSDFFFWGLWRTLSLCFHSPLISRFSQPYHRCYGSGRPWYGDTRVERDGLSHRCLPYYQRWIHWTSVKIILKKRNGEFLSLSATIIRWVVYLFRIFKMFHGLMNNPVYIYIYVYIHIYKFRATAMLFLYTLHNNGLREEVSILLWCGLSHWMIGVLSYKAWNDREMSPWIFWPLRMNLKPSRCLESSSASYPVMQHHIPEEQRLCSVANPPKLAT